MRGIWRAIAVTGTIDEHGLLHLDTPLPVLGPSRAQIVILIPEETAFDEAEWLRSAASNPAFEFLNDSAEDIYTPTDGKPFVDTDPETTSLSNDPEFLEIIERARARLREEGGISSDEMRRRLGLAP